MTRNTLFIILLGVISCLPQVNAQSQRMVLVEEFTQASCPSCASANPAFNALLNANTSKVIPLKYQVWWPGNDPMYIQNQIDVINRVNFYGVSGVPSATMDGNVFQAYPASLTQSMINTEYAVASPFTLNLSHALTPMLDTVNITVVVTATQSVSGNLRLHTVLTENRITFSTPPGSNGETEFGQVMRKMVAGAAGEILSTTWVNGQTQTFSYSLPVPDYYYTLKQLAVLAFIQNGTDKNVKQAVFSPPLILTSDSLVDAGISGLSGIDPIVCSMPLNCTVMLKNFGSVPVTSANVLYQVDNGNWSGITWTGNLVPGASEAVILPGITSTEGMHSLRIRLTAPNGVPDLYPVNNTQVTSFKYSTIGQALPVNEGFLTSAFPPPDWFLKDIGNTGKTWTRTTSCGGFGLSTTSARIPFYSMATVGEIDELYLPQMNLDTAAGARLVFNVAHSMYSTSYIDRLKVMASSDCGENWVTLYDKQGSVLATAPNSTSSFVPTASQWRSDTVDLSAFAGDSLVTVKFVAVNGYGNNLYVDDVRLMPLYSKLQGNVVYKNNPNSAISNAVVSLLKNGTVIQTTTSGSAGEYLFSELVPGNYQVQCVPVNGWGGGNSTDALLILKHFTNIAILSGLNRKAADVDGNGFINSVDALWVAKRFVGLVSGFPGGNWVSENLQVNISGTDPVILPLKTLCLGDVDGSFVPGP